MRLHQSAQPCNATGELRLIDVHSTPRIPRQRARDHSGKGRRQRLKSVERAGDAGMVCVQEWQLNIGEEGELVF